MSYIPRQDAYLNEIIEILDNHLKRNKHDYAQAFNTLSKDEDEFINLELMRCTEDPRYYLENYHCVKTEEDGFKTLFPFWDSQEIFYAEIQTLIKAGLPVKVIVLKARQLGLSTISEGLIFHRTVFFETINSLIVAQDPGQADYLFSMFTRAYENLPWWMKPEVRFRSKGRYMVFDTDKPDRQGLNSEIFVEAANKMTGVSVGKTIRAAHMSELSAWNDASTLTQQIFPTMNAKDELAILESTARGRQGFWYKFWRMSVDKWGDGSWEWKPIFIEWFRCSVTQLDNKGKYSRTIDAGKKFDPTPDELIFREKIFKSVNYYIADEMFQWRRMKIQETITLEGDEFGFYQEYPSNWMEAFQVSGICAFPKRKLQTIMEKTCCNPRWVGEVVYRHGAQQEIMFHSVEFAGELCPVKPTDTLPGTNQTGYRFRVWEKPEDGESYYVAADPSHGIEGGDPACVQICRIGRGGNPDEQVAEWHGWMNPSPFGHIVVGICKWYNNAELAVEMNSGIGEKCYMEVMRILEYPNLFRWKHYDKVKNFYTDFMGWLTNSKTRDLIITGMRERLMGDLIVLRSHALLDEMMAFAQDEDGGRFEGQNTNDDRVMAMMICEWCAHDSDYGKEAAAKHTTGQGPSKYFVFDSVGKLVKECDQRDEAWGLSFSCRPGCPRHIYNPQTPASHAGWSFRREMLPKDFANSDFSPIHDRQGPRANMFYNQGIAAEHISASTLVEYSGNEEDDWKNT